MSNRFANAVNSKVLPQVRSGLAHSDVDESSTQELNATTPPPEGNAIGDLWRKLAAQVSPVRSMASVAASVVAAAQSVRSVTSMAGSQVGMVEEREGRFDETRSASLYFGNAGYQDEGVDVVEELKGSLASFQAEDDFKNMDVGRFVLTTPDNKYRKGCITRETLLPEEKIVLHRNACLEIVDEHFDVEEHQEHPFSKTLLTYLVRLGDGTDCVDNIDIAYVETLIESGASFNFSDKHGQPIFFAVVRDWSTDVAEYAIARGADVNFRDNYGRTALHVACSVNNGVMVKFLLANGALISEKTFGELQTPMHIAARYNAVDAIRELMLNFSNDLLMPDLLNRSPIHIAAEYGQRDSVRYLMNMGLPVEEFDVFGQALVVKLAKNMPHLCSEALNQFYTTDCRTQTRKFYFDCLEYPGQGIGYNPKAESITRVIVENENLLLIVHPVIREYVEVKRSLFGQKYVLFDNTINILFSLLFVVSHFAIVSRSSAGLMDGPIRTWIWQFVLAGLLLAMNIYLFFKSLTYVAASAKRLREWKKHELDVLNRKAKFCHPRWPNEKEFIERHRKIVLDTKLKAVKSFDLINFLIYFLLFGWMAIQAYNILTPNATRFRWFNVYGAVVLFFMLLRLLQSLKLFRVFAPVTILLGAVAMDTIKFIVFYLDIFVPFMMIFWMMFGGGEELADKTKSKTSEEYNNIFLLIYQTGILAVRDSYDRDVLFKVQPFIAEVLLGIYFLIVSIFMSNLFVAQQVDVLARLKGKIKAQTQLSVTETLLRCEARESSSSMRNNRRYLRSNCSPLILPEKEDIEDEINLFNASTKRVFGEIHEAHTNIEHMDISDIAKQNNIVEKVRNYSGDIAHLHKIQQSSTSELHDMKAKMDMFSQKGNDLMAQAMVDFRKRKAEQKRAAKERSEGYVSE